MLHKKETTQANLNNHSNQLNSNNNVYWLSECAFMAKTPAPTTSPASKPNPNYPSTTGKPSGTDRGNRPKK